MSTSVDRVFLDANVLFSVGYLKGSRLGQLWRLPKVDLVTSEFALEEARRNLLAYRADGISQLEALAAQLAVVAEAPATVQIPGDVEVAEKDMPILAAAVSAACTHHHHLFFIEMPGCLPQPFGAEHGKIDEIDEVIAIKVYG